MSYQQQAGWEWSQEDERRWESENVSLDRDIAMYEHFETRQPTDEQVNKRLLADFDSIFMTDKEIN